MALSSSMYAAVTGLSALGTGMQTIANNIANVNTVGFKAMRTNYEDLISQSYYSGGRPNQKGTGVRVSSIQSMFTQGAFMSSAQDTDMAIAGEGFFSVRNAITGAINYTRAGVFTLTKDGYMEDPSGNILQGWKLAIPKPGQAPVKIGAPVDIKLTVLNAPPSATTEMKICTNLNAEAKPAYDYRDNQLAFDYADPIAHQYALEAQAAAEFQIWNKYCNAIEISQLVTVTYPDPPTNWTSGFTAQHVVPGLTIPTAASLGLTSGAAYSIPVTFTQYVRFKDHLGVTHYQPITTTAIVDFRLQNSAYAVNANVLSSASLTTAVGGNPVTATTTESTTLFWDNNLPPIVFSYTPSQVAMMPHWETEEFAGTLTKTYGIKVPGPGDPKPASLGGGVWVIGEQYTVNVPFTTTIEVPTKLDIYGQVSGATREVTVTAEHPVTFTIQANSYNSAVVVCNNFTAPLTITYLQEDRASGSLPSGPVQLLPGDPISLGNPLVVPASGSNVADAYGNRGAGPGGAWLSGQSFVSIVTFTKTVPIRKPDGVIQNMPVTTTAPVTFIIGNTGYNVSSTALSNTSSARNIGAGASVNTPGFTWTVWEPKTETWTVPNAVTNPTNFPMLEVTRIIDGVRVPAANPNGSPPTYSGDAYYQYVTFTQPHTFTDVTGTLRTEIVTKTLLMPFEMRNEARIVTTVTTSSLTFDFSYMVRSPAPVGGALNPAYYNSAMVDFTSDKYAEGAYAYDRNFLETYLNFALGTYSSASVSWLQEQIRYNPLAALNSLVVVNDTGLDWPPIQADRIIPTGMYGNPEYPDAPPYLFKIGFNEVSRFNLIAEELTKMDAIKHGETVYATVYDDIYKANVGVIEAYLPEWRLEGLGFAAAWNGGDPKGGYIDTTGIHAEPIIIYDTLGSQRKLMIYYQKNPHMDNVWDYIITCDPLEDARKDANNQLLLSNPASFSGLIQKGKITFTGDGTDRHGGIIKDIEAQNIDFGKSMMAAIGEPEHIGPGFYNTHVWQNATVGGYYTGSSTVDPKTGNLMATDREYEVLWGGVDEDKLKDADDSWQKAFSLYMEYLDAIGDPDLATYKLSSTKVMPEDKVYPSSLGNTETWQERFIRNWPTDSIAIRNSDPAKYIDMVALLPYTGNPATLADGVSIPSWPFGAQRPGLFDKDYRTQGRTSIYWTENVVDRPATVGFTVIDKTTGEREVVRMNDRNFSGPYSFGSGLTITFNKKDVPLAFGEPGQDGFKIGATSEQTVWNNLVPNNEGLFDFSVAFVTSASMAMHPPYPDGMPSIYQNIVFDMGARNPNGLSAMWKTDKDMSTTQYAANNATLFKGQDGHAAGSLQRVSIGEDGVVTGIFSNGFQMELYQIGLTRFINPWGLMKLGDNLFATTRYSGDGAMNEPGNAGTGIIMSNFLEQSNVDVAEEIVNMILTQRGFQANTKTVTTTDSMLEEVIHMKR